MSATGKIVGVNGNMITVAFDGAVAQNEVGYAVLGDKKLMAEIVRVRGNKYFVWVKTRNDTQEVFRAKFIMVSWGEEKKGARA